MTKLSFHQRALVSKVLRGQVRKPDLSHVELRSYRSQALGGAFKKDSSGYLKVRRRAKERLGIETCVYCMREFLSRSLSELRGGLCCSSCRFIHR